MKEVHYRYAILPYRNILATAIPQCRRLGPKSYARSFTNVFLYGRGTENRTLIYGLKARYFAVKLYPHIGPLSRIRTDTSLIKSQVRYH